MNYIDIKRWFLLLPSLSGFGTRPGPLGPSARFQPLRSLWPAGHKYDNNERFQINGTPAVCGFTSWTECSPFGRVWRTPRRTPWRRGAAAWLKWCAAAWTSCALYCHRQLFLPWSCCLLPHPRSSLHGTEIKRRKRLVLLLRIVLLLETARYQFFFYDNDTKTLSFSWYWF